MKGEKKKLGLAENANFHDVSRAGAQIGKPILHALFLRQLIGTSYEIKKRARQLVEEKGAGCTRAETDSSKQIDKFTPTESGEKEKF